MKEGGVWGRDDDLSREVRRGQDDGRESVKGKLWSIHDDYHC